MGIFLGECCQNVAELYKKIKKHMGSNNNIHEKGGFNDEGE